MDYSFFTWSTASFIETRLKEPIEYTDLEKAVGFSYRHIRETFKECTGISLARYILLRRLANSAFEIVHTDKSLTEIAAEYMFDSYDTFTRAFKRVINYLPSDVRSGTCKLRVGRQRILMGMFGPMFMAKGEDYLQPQLLEDKDRMNKIERTNHSCILYGVPRVAYTFEECTPFCAAVKACLNYMGQQINYAYIMAVSGAAFRLRWNTDGWDGGNVDIRNIYEEPYEAFHRVFQAAGRSYRLLKREETDKDGFIRFIKAEIDEGRPVIAFGIIGPPEACLITGYRDNGASLLGWNCFQDNHEFARGVSIDDSGYFVTNSWWENECSIALISVGEQQQELSSVKEILNNALDILTRPKITYRDVNGKSITYAGGQAAYDFWAKAIGDDREFPKDGVLPILFERIMCQNDAQVMVGEGRSYAAVFIEWVGKEHSSVEKLCNQAAEYFRKAAECTFRMNEVKGGFEQDETTTRKFAEPEVRSKIVPLILKAKEYEAKAGELIQEIVKQL